LSQFEKYKETFCTLQKGHNDSQTLDAEPPLKLCKVCRQPCTDSSTERASQGNSHTLYIFNLHLYKIQIYRISGRGWPDMRLFVFTPALVHRK